MAKARVMAGACGFTSVVKVTKIGKMKVRVQIISACQDLRSLNDDLAEVDCSRNVFGKMIESVIYQKASQRLKHPDCPVPCAIIKTIQVELGGAIPRDVVIKIDTVD
ncbi:hypothetical protein GFC01_16790 [Desulfofundulus thermobenzoicus]|uniref:Uncharacterized protein n=1 Tax=Desulfofundulus thermobenzoicus TaxID=29376 RepID=A0A6N7IUX5_9FIRM|nr:hypothetical protein [Desulfofundulus thermobenzoicus]MQL53882.1 hypothetical protein [Desulfofundulus thermobenzoicus]HHW43378.1 hypothetical protein [Desulfotomaculum sp.]